MLDFHNTDWPAVAEQARQRYEALTVGMEGHKMPTWEGLPDMMRADLILRVAMIEEGSDDRT